MSFITKAKTFAKNTVTAAFVAAAGVVTTLLTPLPASAAFDVTAAVAEIDGAVATVGTVGSAIILVGVAIFGFRIVKRVIGA